MPSQRKAPPAAGLALPPSALAVPSFAIAVATAAPAVPSPAFAVAFVVVAALAFAIAVDAFAFAVAFARAAAPSFAIAVPSLVFALAPSAFAVYAPLVWVRGAAIRPVPPHAVVDAAILAAVEADLARGGNEAQLELDSAFRRFETTQPALADRMSALLARPLDETALALGYFLSIAVWLAFERAFRSRLGEVTAEAARAAEEGLALEAEIRATHGEEPLEVDDVVAREQPGILAFVHEHVDTALDVASRGDDADVDVDHVDMVYRAVVALTLALSHAVAPLPGTAPANPGEGELLA